MFLIVAAASGRRMQGSISLDRWNDAFLSRVRRAYQLALEANSSPTGGMWKAIAKRQSQVHAALVAGNNTQLREVFSNPGATDLFYGADNLCYGVLKGQLPSGEENPEARELFCKLKTFDRSEIDFPNPFPGEVGAITDRGLASYRAIQAAYQAWKIGTLVGSQTNPSVVEIGGGLGRTIYYLVRKGVTDCTAIDLPIGMVAQSCFLGATLGPDKLWFPGDPPSWADGRVKLLFATNKLPDRLYDLALNVDSLTEMPRRTALQYGQWINKHAAVFLSINHTRNYFLVDEVAAVAFDFVKYEQQNCPLRPGYVEEIYFLGSDPAQRRRKSIVRALELSGKFWLRRIVYPLHARIESRQLRLRW